MADKRKTVIVGSGPAGLTAAIYTARAGFKPLVLAGSSPGGQLTKTSLVENYPGFANGIDGPKLMEDMIAQAKWCGADMSWDEARKIEGEAGDFKVTLGDGSTIETATVIYATGAKPRTLGVKGELDYQPKQSNEQDVWGEGVTYCAVCDGNFYRNMPVVVVGGGDSAMEEANYLANICKEVTVVHRRDYFRASQVMIDRAKAKPNIKWEIWQTVDEVLGNNAEKGHERRVTGVRLKNTQDGSTKDLSCDGVFIAIGHIPTTKVLKGVVDLDEEGYIVLKEKQQTSKEGIWAAGDCHDKRYRQAVTAAGMGCQAALEVEKWLAEKGI